MVEVKEGRAPYLDSKRSEVESVANRNKVILCLYTCRVVNDQLTACLLEVYKLLRKNVNESFVDSWNNRKFVGN